MFQFLSAYEARFYALLRMVAGLLFLWHSRLCLRGGAGLRATEQTEARTK